MGLFVNISMAKGTLSLLIAISGFVVLLFLLFMVYTAIFRMLRKKARQTEGKADDFMLDLFRIPVLWLIFWILLKIFTRFFLHDLEFYRILQHVNTLLLIFSFAWIAIQTIKAGAFYLQRRLDVGVPDNLKARKNLTQIKVFKAIANSVIVLIALAAALMTFEQARSVGVSLLTSAGIAGIIVGFAAQKSIGLILAGIQLAITQPVRLDDVVIVEGEWGRIEEITLTYVVVKIWDERRLVVPVSYFLEKPFQNWTRTGAAIMGTVFLYVDYAFPVTALRNALPGMLEGDKNWDGRVLSVQITDTKPAYMEVRVLVSSADASKNWDLRTALREKLIAWISATCPETLSKIRVLPVGASGMGLG